jgi:ribose transport system ATP-binding protein
MSINENIVLEARDVKKTFGSTQALKGIQFQLKKGEIHALVGENGAGKSTFIKGLGGGFRFDSGKVFIEGKEVLIDNPIKSNQLGISIIYQEFNLLPALSIGENIFLGRQPMKPGQKWLIDRNTMNKMATDILNSIGFEFDPNLIVEKLPIFAQQIVEIAKALSINSKVLIMDEPTASLAKHEVDTLFDLMKKLKSKGVAIMFVSHRLNEVFAISDRITVFRDGSYVGTVNTKEVDHKRIVQMMVGREISDIYPKSNKNPTDVILETKNLSRKGFFKGINIKVRKGEIVGLAGLVGSGRTEIVRAIIGLDSYDSGEVYVNNERISKSIPLEMFKRGVGFVPEDRKGEGLILSMTASDNLTLPLIAQSHTWSWLNFLKERQISSNMIKQVDVRPAEYDRLAYSFSGGNQQKLVLGKWFVDNIRLIILDEPTRGVDIGAKVDIYHLMRKLVNDGIGILMISSELPELLGMSDRIYVVNDGEICGEFDSVEATEEIILSCAIHKTIF